MSEGDATEVACRRRATCRQYMAACIANLSAFSAGTMTGWTAPMQPLLTSKTPPVGTEPMTTELVSWLGSVMSLGSLAGTLFWGVTSDHLGRKYTAMLVALPFILSWLMTLAAQNATWLVLARIVIGVGCSGIAINIPSFVTEIAEDKIRGSLGSLMNVFLNAGCVFSYVIGSNTSYHCLAAACLCVPIIFLAGMAYLPESPVYLWNSGKRGNAEKSLLWFRGGNIAQTKTELEALKSMPTKSSYSPSFSSLLRSKGVRKALVISLNFNFGQTFCGYYPILTYTMAILMKTGSSLSANKSMIVIGVLQFLAALVTPVLVDRAGRRILLIFSYSAVAISLSTLGGYIYFENTSWNPIFQCIPVLSLSVTVVCFSIGVGPIPFIIVSEILPPEIRGYAGSKMFLLFTVMNFTALKTFSFLVNVIGMHGCFLFYASCCTFSLIITFIIVPETKGKSIQTILHTLSGGEYMEGSELKELMTVDSKKKQISNK